MGGPKGKKSHHSLYTSDISVYLIARKTIDEAKSHINDRKRKFTTRMAIFLQASHIPIDKMKLCTLAIPSLLLFRGAGFQFSQFSAYIVLGCWQKLEIHLELGISI